MNNQKFLKFIESFNKEIKNKRKAAFNEDHYTASILPYFNESLGIISIFNQGDKLKKRPDLTIFLNQNDSERFERAVGFIESKLPFEFENLNTEKVLQKYLSDKIIPYVSSWNSTILFFGLICFNRFILCTLNKDLISKLQSVDITSKDDVNTVIRELKQNCVDLNLSNADEIKNNFAPLVAWFNKNCSLPSIIRRSSESYIGCVKIQNRKDIQRAATSVVDIILADDGVLAAVESKFQEEMDDDKSSVANSLKLFLSIKYPENADDEIQKKLGAKKEKLLFTVASVYNLVSKLFLIRYVDEVYTNDSFPLYEKHLRFFDTSATNKSPEETSTLFISGLKKLRKGSHSLYSKILTKDSLFDWVLDTEILGTESFKQMFMTFQSFSFASPDGTPYTDEDFLGSFFEEFSQRFDPEARKEYGQYYTPKTVVNFIWDKVLDVLNREGIDAKKVKLLDPACGTGSFLTTGVGKLLDDAGLDLQDRLVAFDISPLAVRLTEVNLFLEFLRKLKSNDRPLLKNLEVYNTDALEISESEYWQKRLVQEENADRIKQLHQETELNKKHKKNKEYTLIVTNPPYNGSSARTLESLKGRFTLLDHLIETKQPSDRLRDDYIWFFGAIDRYINDNGVVGLITSDTYLNKSSYRNLRSYLYKNYQIHSIFHLGKNIFDDVKVSTSIIIMSKLEDQKMLSNFDYEIDYFNLRHLKENKSNRSEDGRYMFMNGQIQLEPLKIQPSVENHFSFSSALLLKDVVPFFANKAPVRLVNTKTPGIVTGLNDFFIAKDVATLQTRISSFKKLIANAKACVDQSHFKGFDTTSDGIRKLGFELIDSSKFKTYQTNLKKECLALGIIKAKEKEKSVNQTLLYISMLVSSSILKKITPTNENIRPIISADAKIDISNRWGLRPNQQDYIYFEDELVIPRITQNGSTVSGGPITCWRENHDPKIKVIFTTPSGESGIPRLLLLTKTEKPLMLKTVADGEAEGHFCSLDQIVFPSAFLTAFASKLDAAYYIMGVYNSKWCTENVEYIINHGVPIPLPSDSNKERIIEIARITRLVSEHQQKICSAKSMIDWNKIKDIFKSNNLIFSEESEKEPQKIVLDAENKVDQLVDSLFAESVVQEHKDQNPKQDSEPTIDFNDVLRRRVLISSFIVENLKDDSLLGLVKFQKIFYLIDTVLDVDLKTKYKKEAAGPLDSQFIYNKVSGVAALGLKHNVFSLKKDLVGKKEISRFVADKNVKKYSKSFLKYLEKAPEKLAFANRILREFKNISATKAEVITTLYAILAEANEAKVKMSDKDLMKAFYEWHPKKADKFKDDSAFVQRTLKWMRENSLMPPSFAKSKIAS